MSSPRRAFSSGRERTLPQQILRAYEGVNDARASIGRYLDFYNGRRPHSNKTPDHAYFTPLPLRLAA